MENWDERILKIAKYYGQSIYVYIYVNIPMPTTWKCLLFVGCFCVIMVHLLPSTRIVSKRLIRSMGNNCVVKYRSKSIFVECVRCITIPINLQTLNTSDAYKITLARTHFQKENNALHCHTMALIYKDKPKQSLYRIDAYTNLRSTYIRW